MTTEPTPRAGWSATGSKRVDTAMCNNCGTTRDYTGKLWATNLKCQTCLARTPHNVIGREAQHSILSDWGIKQEQANRAQLRDLARLTELFARLGVEVREAKDGRTWAVDLTTTGSGREVLHVHPRLKLDQRVKWMQAAMNMYVSNHVEPTEWMWPALRDCASDAQKRERLERDCLIPSRWFEGF